MVMEPPTVWLERTREQRDLVGEWGTAEESRQAVSRCLRVETQSWGGVHALRALSQPLPEDSAPSSCLTPGHTRARPGTVSPSAKEHLCTYVDYMEPDVQAHHLRKSLEIRTSWEHTQRRTKNTSAVQLNVPCAFYYFKGFVCKHQTNSTCSIKHRLNLENQPLVLKGNRFMI